MLNLVEILFLIHFILEIYIKSLKIFIFLIKEILEIWYLIEEKQIPIYLTKMKKVGIKTYRLEQFPPNAKVINQGDRIKRFELSYNDQTDIYFRVMQEIRNLYNEEIDRGNNFKLYWKDEENELIVLANDLDFKAALDNANPGEVIKIYIVDDHRSTSNQPNSSFPSAENKNSKKSHTHPGITCNGCNSSIYGLRHKCKSCFNYNLCDECKKKNVFHRM